MSERAFPGGTLDVHDLLAIDREVERAVRAWRTWRKDLFHDPEAREDEDVFIVHRPVATKSLYDALADTPDPAGTKEALRRWIASLLQARLSRDADVAIARAIAAREASPDEVRLVSYREAWRGVVTETARGKSLAWFDAAAARGPALAPLHRERRQRRAEVLRRLGLETDGARGSHAELTPPELAHQDALARGILDATEDLAASLVREERKRESAPAPHPVDAIRISMARGAGEGWPARLTWRWLHELFDGWFTGASGLEEPPLPAALSGASFVRALAAFGQSFRTARFETKGTVPFVLRQDPHFVDKYRMGALMASLGASPVFQRRALGLGRDAALQQARALGTTLLFSLRLDAARVLLGGADDAVWDEITSRLFGVPAPRALAGVWPECRDDEGARLVGAATARPLAQSLVERFDEDWFRNPRASETLRARTLYPARAPIDGALVGGPPEETLEPSQTANGIGRAFEELFG
ncbi:hypothetical protein [Pendulispora albinea]|uniref:Uncharacterized protein n=1 Tax=Pendulispora albinea TaxID=2741071 RepID=A0ABZ2M2N0_9BACT